MRVNLSNVSTIRLVLFNPLRRAVLSYFTFLCAREYEGILLERESADFGSRVFIEFLVQLEDTSCVTYVHNIQ